MNNKRILDAQDWAQEIFGRSELGDVRRTRRAVSVARQLAVHSGSSLARSCEGDAIAQEGAYRLMRNDKVQPEALMQSGFDATRHKAEGYKRLLEIQDTTTLSYSHSVSGKLGDLGGPDGQTGSGLWVHSALLVDADSEQTIGLIDQDYWQRAQGARGIRHQRKERAYEEKESYKWQSTSQRVSTRLGEKMAEVVTVCDREADVFEYLHYKCARGERFIVRAAQDRRLWQEEATLFEQARRGCEHGWLQVQVGQRGGRQARKALVQLRSAQVRLNVPKGPGRQALEPITLNVVLAEEQGEAAERLCWLLLSSEPIGSESQVVDILRCYGLRWRIEEFHKAWKSGAGVEKLRMQRQENLMRMAVILAFVAVRLLQLREVLDNKVLAELPCTAVLDEQQWKILWVSTQACKKLPDSAPTLEWAYRAIAKLGGFTNTKRTGRASWETMWYGWAKLNERVAGHRLLKDVES